MKCGNCRFWISLDDVWSGVFDDCRKLPLLERGLCRRYPPTLVDTGESETVHLELLDEHDQPTGEFETTTIPAEARFPAVDATEWCGEWKPITTRKKIGLSRGQ